MSEVALMRAVAKRPVIIYFDVQQGFEEYSGGIYQV